MEAARSSIWLYEETHLLRPRHKLPAAPRSRFDMLMPWVVSFAAGRQCRWSTCMERENLAGDAKGKRHKRLQPRGRKYRTSRGGLLRSSSPPALPTHSE